MGKLSTDARILKHESLVTEGRGIDILPVLSKNTNELKTPEFSLMSMKTRV